RELKPLKEAHEHQAKVPLLQTALTLAQDDLKTLQSKLSELRMEAIRLSAEFKLRVRNQRQRLLSPQRKQQPEHRIKLSTIQRIVREYEAEAPKRIQQVARAASAAFEAKRSAEIAYDKAERAFEFKSKMCTLRIVLALWSILFFATWI